MKEYANVCDTEPMNGMEAGPIMQFGYQYRTRQERYSQI